MENKFIKIISQNSHVYRQIKNPFQTIKNSKNVIICNISHWECIPYCVTVCSGYIYLKAQSERVNVAFIVYIIVMILFTCNMGKVMDFE